MLQRVLSSLIGLPVLLYCIFWHAGLLFRLGIILLSLAGVAEFYAACSKQGFRPLAGLGLAAALLFLLPSALPDDLLAAGWLRAVVTGCLLVGLVAELARKERAPVKDLGTTFLGALYGGWLFRYLLLLRGHGAALLASVGGAPGLPLPGMLGDAGAWVVVLVIASTWAGDSGAFFIGRALGRHKLAPTISPGKTIEGAAGGALCSLVMALAVGGFLLRLDFRLAAGLGALIGILAPVGDLCESAVKRELGIKDFSSLFPGHGGVLDRFDSLLFTAPVVYYVLTMVSR